MPLPVPSLIKALNKRKTLRESKKKGKIAKMGNRTDAF